MPGTLHRRIWPSRGDSGIPGRHRRACGYETFSPAPIAGLRRAVSSQLAALLAEAQSALQGLNAAFDPALRPLARLLLRTESIASSKVEGLQVGTRALARAEATADTGGRIGDTAREILANIDAMERAIDQATEREDLGVDEIREIHRVLMQTGPTPRIAGRIRTVQNWIGGNDWTPCGADFVPPPPEELPALLADLCGAMNETALPPLMQAGLVHAQFETIHPFADGNGRTGRALIHVLLRRRGLTPHFVPPVSVIFAGRKDRYIAGLERFRGEDPEPWLGTFVGAVLHGAELAAGYLRQVRELQERWRERLAAGPAPRRGATAWALLDELPAMPMVTTPVAVARLERAKSSVQQAIADLLTAGILRPARETRRNQVWESPELLDLIEALEAGEPPPGP